MRPVSVQVRRLMLPKEKERYENLFEIGRFLEQSDRFDLANKLQHEVDLVAQPAVERMLRYEHRPNNKGTVALSGSEVPEPVVMQGGKIVDQTGDDEQDRSQSARNISVSDTNDQGNSK